MAGRELTDTEVRIHRFLVQHRARTGTYATVRDIQRHFRYKSPSTPHEHLLRMLEKGIVEKRFFTADSFVYAPIG